MSKTELQKAPLLSKKWIVKLASWKLINNNVCYFVFTWLSQAEEEALKAELSLLHKSYFLFQNTNKTTIFKVQLQKQLIWDEQSRALAAKFNQTKQIIQEVCQCQTTN